MELLPFGDQALLVNFEQRVQVEVNQKVMAMYRAVKAADRAEVTFLIPAYCSLVIGYNPEISDFQHLRSWLKELKIEKEGHVEPERKLKIPVCYHPSYGLDLKEVAKLTGLDVESIIDLHTSHTFRVFMLGFLPGFAYMGPLPEKLQCARKSTPREKVPPGSVGLAGNQTGIYPDEAPGGWRIIGKSPLPIFSTQGHEPFLFQAGDLVRFEAIEDARFQEIQVQCTEGTFDWESIYET